MLQPVESRTEVAIACFVGRIIAVVYPVVQVASTLRLMYAASRQPLHVFDILGTLFIPVATGASLYVLCLGVLLLARIEHRGGLR